MVTSNSICCPPQDEKTYFGYKVVRKSTSTYDKEPCYYTLASVQGANLLEWVRAWDRAKVKFAGFHFFTTYSAAHTWYKYLCEDILDGTRRNWWAEYGQLTIVRGEFAKIVAAGISWDGSRIAAAEYWRPIADMPSSTFKPPKTVTEKGKTKVIDQNTGSVACEYKSNNWGGTYYD